MPSRGERAKARTMKISIENMTQAEIENIADRLRKVRIGSYIERHGALSILQTEQPISYSF